MITLTTDPKTLDPATPEAAEFLTLRIRNTNNGYLFAPNPWETATAKEHPDKFKRTFRGGYHATVITIAQ